MLTIFFYKFILRAMKSEKSKKFLSRVGFYGLLLFFALLRAVASYVFIVPNAFAPGGVGGIASIVYNVVNLYDHKLAEGVFNPAVTIFVLNLPLIIASFFTLNKQFAINTTIVTVGYSGFMALFSALKLPVFQGSGMESSLTIISAIAGGVISGVALGGSLLTNSSAGGTDILGKIANKKKPELNTSWFIFLFDSIVVLLSGIVGLLSAKGMDANTTFVKIASPIFYSFITLFLTSEVADVITTGTQSSVVFNIITDKAEEVGDAIVQILHRGGTIIHAEGIYTNSTRKILVCVVKKKQSALLKQIIKDVDPDAFTYINKAKEVSGFGFRNNQ